MKHEDERGVIEDLLVTENGAVTRITFKPGAVRGNHYHKETVQHDFILKGKLVCYSGNKRFEVMAGEMVEHKPLIPHAYKALEESEMVSCVYGPRKGEDYSKDTYKLETPLCS